MKICFLAHASSIHTRRWVQYFVREGHQVSVISLSSSDPIPGVELYLLTSKLPISHEHSNWQYLLQMPRLRRTIRRIDPDLLNAHFLSSNGLMGAMTKSPDRPFVITVHGSDAMIIAGRSLLHRRAAEYSISRSDLLISVAQHMTDKLADYNKNEVPIITLQYGIDTGTFTPPAASNPRQAICFSNRRLVANSNLDLLLKAARILEQQESSVKIHIAGTGELHRQLLDKVTEWDLDHRITILGHIDHSDMPDYLRQSAIFVSLVWSDGAPLSLLEAMACGTFPIVSDIPANREWIEDGINGFVVPLSSANELALKIEQAWKKEELRSNAAAINWKTVKQRADYETNMAAINRAFVNLVDDQRIVS